MILEAEFQCAYCGKSNPTTVDLSAGRQQEYVEDCQVCCRPNRLHIEINPDTLDATIEADEES